ncbi:MAG: dihydroorotate dehydrogenase electron transfer subunit [Thermoplasmata archaeon]
MYRITKVEKKVMENDNVFTIIFNDNVTVRPGQFAMIWIPGVDEFPMSFSYTRDKKGFTFKILGDGTRALSMLKEEDRIFYRGPYGKYYTEEGNKAIFIAGGTGIASIAPFVETSNFNEKIVILGAKTKNDIFFEERLRKYSSSIKIYTEDGSMGEKGLATDALSFYDYDTIYACGPEKMIRAIVDQNTKKNIQASLERYMKCGIGICDSCTINGYRVCVDGPVFNKDELLSMNDLGKNYRLPSGKILRI